MRKDENIVGEGLWQPNIQKYSQKTNRRLVYKEGPKLKAHLGLKKQTTIQPAPSINITRVILFCAWYCFDVRDNVLFHGILNTVLASGVFQLPNCAFVRAWRPKKKVSLEAQITFLWWGLGGPNYLSVWWGPKSSSARVRGQSCSWEGGAGRGAC